MIHSVVRGLNQVQACISEHILLEQKTTHTAQMLVCFVRTFSPLVASRPGILDARVFHWIPIAREYTRSFIDDNGGGDATVGKMSRHGVGSRSVGRWTIFGCLKE